MSCHDLVVPVCDNLHPSDFLRETLNKILSRVAYRQTCLARYFNYQWFKSTDVVAKQATSLFLSNLTFAQNHFFDMKI